ncbi:MAG: hypothetical protein RL662_1235 [Bacteroidota bacterium]|jgi:hypothetical protein
MKKYNLINNLFGWLSFAIAAVVYLMTIEPTASFWDCGEFITSAYKLEVGHPPGAPFFMLTGKFFTLFASDPSQVALMINAMSALLSAATILFLFWTITHLAKKLIYISNEQDMTMGQMIAIIGSGLVGSLVYTFSDTFWFSAVEGEVYAYSSMFTALVFWLILKWENRAEQSGSDKWLVLLAYVMGLSIGVHLLNLLCIPAIVLVYYFKKVEKPNFKGILLALLASLGLIMVLMYGVIPGFAKVGGQIELFFVNSLGFSYNTGVFTYLILMFISIVWGLFETLSDKGSIQRAKIAFIACMTLSGIVFISSNWVIWIILFGGLVYFCFKTQKATFRMLNTSLLCLLVILIGYSSFALIPIRSAANTPMDQNSPEDVFSLTDYLNREQYGDNPLFYGRTYASTVKRDYNGKVVEASKKEKYDKAVKKSANEKDQYIVVSESPKYDYTNSMLLPRMYSEEPRHVQGYKNWGGITDTKTPPTFMQNVQYLISYQINFMYWRYFMWNFSGRQNDIQSLGEISNGNWITGIGFIDEHVLGLGPQDNLPPDIADNKGHNAYYMLPLVLGILGLCFQLTRGKKGEQQLWITFMLFFMTGLAIVMYLNQKPYEPRERDYAYAGSFYAFSIWIGLGVAALWTLAKKYMAEHIAAALVTAIALCVPIQMACQNWDDHDRSDRYTMRDFGMNYLRSVAKDGIIFTNGDNDTFPLWYAQEVEGFRTDVRVTNLSYLQTDWYVDQMRRQAYDSPPLPIDWEKANYIGDKGVYAYVLTKSQVEGYLSQQLAQKAGVSFADKLQGDQSAQNLTAYYDSKAFTDSISLDNIMEILRTKDKYVPNNPFIQDDNVFIIPGNKLYMNIDTAAVDWKALNAKPSATMSINLGDKNVVYRNEIMILEMLSNINKQGWKRPIYFATTVGNDMYMNLKNTNFQLEGMAYRITPGVISETGVNTDVAYENMVNQYKWGGIENPKVYLDDNNLRTCKTFRIFFAELISALIQEGKNEKALAALDYCLKVIPHATVPMEGESVTFADFYYELGHPEKAQQVIEQITSRVDRSLLWYHRLQPAQMAGCSNSMRDNFDTLLRIAMVYQRNGMNEQYKALIEKLQLYVPIYFGNGVHSFGNYALKNIADIALRGYYSSAEDTAKQKVEEELAHKSMQLMKQFNPDLLKEYTGQSNN